jgi:transposase-like protein
MENSGDSRREALALALAGGRTIRGACRSAGVSESACYEWLRDPQFKALVTEQRSRLFDVAVGKLADRCALAAGKLFKLMRSKDERVQLSAAKAVLEQGVSLRASVELAREYADLQRRLDRLEELYRVNGSRLPPPPATGSTNDVPKEAPDGDHRS